MLPEEPVNSAEPRVGSTALPSLLTLPKSAYRVNPSLREKQIVVNMANTELYDPTFNELQVVSEPNGEHGYIDLNIRGETYRVNIDLNHRDTFYINYVCHDLDNPRAGNFYIIIDNPNDKESPMRITRDEIWGKNVASAQEIFELLKDKKVLKLIRDK